MDAKTHWRRGSKSTFYIDHEKDIGDPVPQPKQRASSFRGLLALLTFLVLGAVFGMYAFTCSTHIQQVLALRQFQVDHENLLLEVYGDHSATDCRNQGWLLRLFHAVTDNAFESSGFSITSSDLELVDQAVLEGTTPDELWKLDDHLRWKEQLLHKPPYVEAMEEADPKQDLKEMLLVAPVVVLLDDEDVNSASRREFMAILNARGSGFRLTPEPVVVYLDKHPHRDGILSYLRRYMSHELAHHISEGLEEDDIPRLFIGGLPMGNYQHVIESFRAGDLMDELIEKGNGLVSIL